MRCSPFPPSRSRIIPPAADFDLGWEYYCSEEPIAKAFEDNYNEPDPAMGPPGLHDGPDAATAGIPIPGKVESPTQ